MKPADMFHDPNAKAREMLQPRVGTATVAPVAPTQLEPLAGTPGPVTTADVDLLIAATDQLSAATLAAAFLKPGDDADAMAEAMTNAERVIESK